MDCKSKTLDYLKTHIQSIDADMVDQTMAYSKQSLCDIYEILLRALEGGRRFGRSF